MNERLLSRGAPEYGNTGDSHLQRRPMRADVPRCRPMRAYVPRCRPVSAYVRQWPPMRALGTASAAACRPIAFLRLCFVCTPVLLFFLLLLRRSDGGFASARGCNAAAAEIALPGLSSVSSYRSCCCCCAQQPPPQKKTAAATTTTTALRRAARFCGTSIRR